MDKKNNQNKNAKSTFLTSDIHPLELEKFLQAKRLNLDQFSVKEVFILLEFRELRGPNY